MPRKQIQRFSEATRACAAAVPAPVETGVATTDAATSLKPAPLDAGIENDRVGSPSAAPPRAEAPIPARREGARSLEPSSAAAAPVETDIETGKAKTAPKRAPLDGDLIRRRWRSLIDRRPPKALSHALMDRILAWREQVAESGDISPRSRTILTAVLTGKKTDGQVQGNETNQDHGARSARSGAALRVGAALIREHAGVLHRVTVIAEGFEWDGRIYGSLSAVARAITGVRWNGRRFFALDRGATQVVARNASERTARARRASRESSRVGGNP